VRGRKKEKNRLHSASKENNESQITSFFQKRNPPKHNPDSLPNERFYPENLNPQDFLPKHLGIISIPCSKKVGISEREREREKRKEKENRSEINGRARKVERNHTQKEREKRFKHHIIPWTRNRPNADAMLLERTPLCNANFKERLVLFARCISFFGLSLCVSSVPSITCVKFMACSRIIYRLLVSREGDEVDEAVVEEEEEEVQNR